MIGTSQLGELSDDINRRVENAISGSDQPTEQALEQAFVKSNAIFHKKCLSKCDGEQLRRLQVDLTENVGLISIQIRVYFY